MKWFVKGTTYGSFPPNSRGEQFPEIDDTKRDFELMRRAGINAFLTYTVPPLWLLDLAQDCGLRAIVVVPWMEYVCFLQDRQTRQQMIHEVQEGVRSCMRHPAVLMYCIGKEIPPTIVRWHGPKKVETFLRDLCDAAKQEDPQALVTYTSFATTEYLELPFVDVFTFNVYLHGRQEFCSYLSRLQNIAGELPFVLTEFGMCSFRNGEEAQAAFLDWQIEEIFDHGLAGAVVFGWTDPFYQDSCRVEEWGFGLVDAERRPKASYQVVKHRFTDCVPFPADRKWPKVSVIVAAHNAGRTLYECLRSLEELEYSNYEVIVVNDGSTDDTEEIMRQFPFRRITTANQGVSAARNEGLRLATGRIIAYIDSDAKADPQWLHYLASTYMKFPVAGAGGPNIVPREDNWVSKCVYRSPGGPTQVMFDDQYAEHIPGCNMTFLKSALDDIGGFDPVFRAAADDVDICWRLLERGYRIGFSPAAVVWHHRRPSVKAYWKQQVGYGVSESILERKMPEKFNPWGHTFWAGRIYGPYPVFRLMSKPFIYHGIWGSAPFQPMYEPGGANLLSFLPRAMEWHTLLFAATALGFFVPWMFIPVGLGIAYTVGYCIVCAKKANLNLLLETERETGWRARLKWRTMLVLLHLIEPLARDWGRIKGGLMPWRSVFPHARTAHRSSSRWQRLQPFRRTARWSIPGNMMLDKYPFLDRLLKELAARGCATGWNPITVDWDLKARRGALGIAFLRLAVEHHGGPKRLVRLSALIHMPRSLVFLLVGLIVLAGVLGMLRYTTGASVLVGSIALLWCAASIEANRLEAVLISAASDVAQELQVHTWQEPACEGELAVKPVHAIAGH